MTLERAGDDDIPAVVSIACGTAAPAAAAAA